MRPTRKSLSIQQYRSLSRESAPSNPYLCTPKTRSPLAKRRTLCTTGNARQMDVAPHVGEISRSLRERVKEHSKSSTSAIHKHCTDFHHPLPSIKNFSIIDKDSSQVTREAKEAIHIQRLDPNLNRNIGKMSIPHCFDPLIGAKPKYPQVGLLSQALHPVDEVAPLSQIPGLNLTQFNEIGTFRPNPHQFLDRRSTRACRARALQN